MGSGDSLKVLLVQTSDRIYEYVALNYYWEETNTTEKTTMILETTKGNIDDVTIKALTSR